MREKLEQCRSDGVSLCDRLLDAMKENREDAHSFFAGELYQAYVDATDKARSKVKSIRIKIRNL